MARRLDRADRGEVVELVERLARRERKPLRRLHPRHPAAFLINADKRPLTAVERAQFVGQRAHLTTVNDIAPEQNIARRFGIAEERALVGGQRWS